MKRTKRRVLIQRIEQAELEGATDLQTLQGRSLSEVLLDIKKSLKDEGGIKVFDKCFWDSQKRGFVHSRYMLNGRRYTQLKPMETLILCSLKDLGKAYKRQWNTLDVIIQEGKMGMFEREEVKSSVDILLEKGLIKEKFVKLGHCRIPMFRL